MRLCLVRLMLHTNTMTQGHIVIASDVENEIERIVQHLHPSRVVVFYEENFKIEHAKSVMSEAYISESQTKYIVMGALEFTSVAQNSLLKLLEEPPSNIEFIVVSPTKSNLLPTVRSRMPIVTREGHKTAQAVEISLKLLNYAEVFAFLKQHSRITKQEAKDIVEALYFQATLEDKLILNTLQLESFDKAFRLLELNSRPQSVLAMLIMSFAKEK